MRRQIDMRRQCDGITKPGDRFCRRADLFALVSALIGFVDSISTSAVKMVDYIVIWRIWLYARAKHLTPLTSARQNSFLSATSRYR